MVLTRNIANNQSFPTNVYRQHIVHKNNDNQNVEEEDHHNSLLGNNTNTSRMIELSDVHHFRNNNTMNTMENETSTSKWTEYSVRLVRLIRDAQEKIDQHVKERGALGVACNAAGIVSSQLILRRFGGKVGATIICRSLGAIAGFFLSDAMLDKFDEAWCSSDSNKIHVHSE